MSAAQRITLRRANPHGRINKRQIRQRRQRTPGNGWRAGASDAPAGALLPQARKTCMRPRGQRLF
jgi:hypothetical protein